MTLQSETGVTALRGVGCKRRALRDFARLPKGCLEKGPEAGTVRDQGALGGISMEKKTRKGIKGTDFV